jgi:adenylylsulfate kinase-like enzyme
VRECPELRQVERAMAAATVGTLHLMHDEVAVLLLTGTVASGKTTIANEIAQILPPEKSIAAIDLDQLGWAYIPDASSEAILRLRMVNLAAIWPNIRSAGLRHVVVSGAVYSYEALELVRLAIVRSPLTVVRLLSPPQLREARLRARDSGRELVDHLSVMPEIDDQLDRSELEDFQVTNDERSPRSVATSILERIGWV